MFLFIANVTCQLYLALTRYKGTTDNNVPSEMQRQRSVNEIDRNFDTAAEQSPKVWKIYNLWGEAIQEHDGCRSHTVYRK